MNKRQAEEKGYEFSGIYTRDTEEAKIKAKEERAKGNKAIVVFEPSNKLSRGGGCGGFSVYIITSETNKQQEARELKESRKRRLFKEKEQLLIKLAEVEAKLNEEEGA